MNTLVQITYGVRKHPDHDGWLPVVTEHVEGNKPHTSAPWGRPLDEDHALFLAKDTAEDWASRYSGDFTVVVSEAAPERGPRRNPLTLVEELDALAARFADLDEDELIETNIHSALSPILQRHLGYSLGPSADWVNPTWELGDDLYLFENDADGEYAVLRRDAESDEIEEVKEIRDLDALRRYFRMRRNPRRKAPPPSPPPPSHTFALEADPYQQGLFAPSSYEAKPKKRTVEPAPVDERQVDLFASPPPAKKNPRAAENGRYHYVMSCPGSTYEDIQALQESEQTVSRATFAKAIGSQAWRDIQASLGYDRDFPITKDWHVGYYKGVFRGVPCYFLRHSRIEHIYTLDGKLGPSLAGDDE